MKINKMSLKIIIWILCVAFVKTESVKIVNSYSCRVPDPLKREIHGYQSFVNDIIELATRGQYSGRYYDDLTKFIDSFGNRISGSKNLERSIRNVGRKAASEGLKVHLEPVQVPYWIRGHESAYMLTPRKKELKIMGLGYSPNTNESGITADVIVVESFDELKKKAEEVKGNIVLFNAAFVNYETTVPYRSNGPSEASKLGAVGTLVRSITPFSIYSPHAGTTSFSEKVTKIPAAAVTLEDADLIARLFKRGHRVTVNLKMDATLIPDKTSHNLLIDIPGISQPDHFVTVSGHIDSWDVGQGALDDGVGAFLALHSLLLLKFINAPKPRRTIRAILWTGEEEGLIGAQSYLAKHKDELLNWTAALESDAGSYTTLGLQFEGNDDAHCIVKEIATLFKNLNATEAKKTEGVGSDISIFKKYGVPLLQPYFISNNYMWFHHSEGDSIRTLNPTIMDENLAVFSATSYILANISVQLPRGQQTLWDMLHNV